MFLLYDLTAPHKSRIFFGVLFSYPVSYISPSIWTNGTQQLSCVLCDAGDQQRNSRFKCQRIKWGGGEFCVQIYQTSASNWSFFSLFLHSVTFDKLKRNKMLVIWRPNPVRLCLCENPVKGRSRSITAADSLSLSPQSEVSNMLRCYSTFCVLTR